MDENTIVRVLLGERARLYGYIWSIVRDDHLAEDLLQDVAILALEKRGDIEGETHLLGWLRNAAKFKSLKALDARRRRHLTLGEAALEALDAQWRRTDDEASSSDMCEALRRCLGELTPRARKVVELRYFRKMSGAEVAAALDRKVRTVYVALSRIHRDLGECIRRRLRAADSPGRMVQ